jgi:hypothetical protein
VKRIACALVLAAVAAGAAAQAPQRIRGTITAVDGNVMAVKSREGKDLQLHLAPEVGVSTAKAATLADLKGKYVGVTAREKDGRLVAVEVHAIPPQAPSGHMKWDLEPGSSMTNANLDAVARVTGGDEITMSYKGGSQKILVPPGTPVVVFVPGSRADLKPGEYIFTIAQQAADGKLAVQRVSVSKDGVKPPQ